MFSNMATGLIANRVAQTLTSFEAINAIEMQADDEDSQAICTKSISDMLSKFKLWAGNIGAHRTGRSSLDYRLRDSSHLHKQVVRLLDDIISSLHEVYLILSGETCPWDRDAGEAEEIDEELKDLLVNESFEFESELDQLKKGIDDTIGNLLRLSISLRNPTPHDHFMSTEYAEVHYFEANDKAHVEAKFPKASQALILRLGQALSRRRQYFRYREAHHEKLAYGLYDSRRSDAGAQSTVASSIPSAMRDPEAGLTFGQLDEDERSDMGFSQISFLTTAPESERLSIPPMPKRAYDGPFECPFCFMMISLSSTDQWKDHILRDLKPYFCLMEDCPAANEGYSCRHEWMNHLFQKHWTSWICPYQCGFCDKSETSLREHVIRVHPSATQMELDMMILRCSETRPVSSSSPVNCPLCQDALESIQQYQTHVGRHQVELALFVLPRIDEEYEELVEHYGDQETLNTSSTSRFTPNRVDSPPPTSAIATDTPNAQSQIETSLHPATSVTDRLATIETEPKERTENVNNGERAEDQEPPEHKISLTRSRTSNFVDSRPYGKKTNKSKWRWNCCNCSFQNLSYDYDHSCHNCGHRRDSDCPIWAVA